MKLGSRRRRIRPPIGIQDDFSEITQIGELTYQFTSSSQGSGGRFREVDGVRGALRDLFEGSIEDRVNIVFRRGQHGFRIRPFVRIGTNDRYLTDVFHRLTDVRARIQFDRHEMKYNIRFRDPDGVVTGVGFRYQVFGDVSLRYVPEELFVRWQHSPPRSYTSPLALIRFRGHELLRLSAYPLFKRGDPEWRPYRDGDKVRIDVTSAVDKVFDIDPSSSFTGNLNQSGSIQYSLPANPFFGGAFGTNKAVGFSGAHINGYDRFDTTTLPLLVSQGGDATLTNANYWQRWYITPLQGTGVGPNAGLWLVNGGWNVLSDPLVIGDLWSVRDQAGSYQYQYGQLTAERANLYQPAAKLWWAVPMPLGWIRNNGSPTSELHDIEIDDNSAYDGGESAIWFIYRTPSSATPYLELIYTLPRQMDRTCEKLGSQDRVRATTGAQDKIRATTGSQDQIRSAVGQQDQIRAVTGTQRRVLDLLGSVGCGD